MGYHDLFHLNKGTKKDKEAKGKKENKKRDVLVGRFLHRSHRVEGTSTEDLGSHSSQEIARPTIAGSSVAPSSILLSSSSCLEGHQSVDAVTNVSDIQPNITSASAVPSALKEVGTGDIQEPHKEATLTSNSTSHSNDLWDEGFQSLSPEERQQLQIIIEEAKTQPDPTTKPMKFPHEGAQILIAIAQKNQDEWKDRRWKFEVHGHEIEPRTYTKSIISCLSTAGDIGVNYLPQPASIVWPLVKGLMQVPINADAEIGAALMTAETVVRTISCGHLYEEIYLGKIEGELRESLRSALVQVYAASLKLLSYALKQLDTNTAKRLLLAFLNHQETQDQVTDLKESYSHLTEVTQICQSQITVQIDDRVVKFLEKFHNFDSFAQKSFSELFERLDEEKLSKILDWISPTKEFDRHAELKKNRALNTYRGRIVYYYCRRKEKYEDPDDVIRSLLRQLATPTQGSNEIHRDVQALFKEMGNHASQLPIETCKQQLPKSLQQYDQVTFVIDALDECEKGAVAILLDTIDSLLSHTDYPTRIFVSARPDSEIKNRFIKHPIIQTDNSDVREDIEIFIDQEIPKFSHWNKFSIEEQKEIREKLLAKSNGMFQWVFLQTANLKTCQMPEDVLDGIEEMPTELPKAYEHIYEIISKRKSQKELVDRAFMWIMCSRAPLTSDILLTGVGFGGDSNTVHKKISKYQLLDLCHNLVVFDDSRDLWRFSHASVAEYAEEKGLWSLQKSHTYAGIVCLRYLMIAYGKQESDKCFESKEMTASINATVNEGGLVFPDDDKFLEYCRHHWPLHIQCYERITQPPEKLDICLMGRLRTFLESPNQSGLVYQRWHEHIQRDFEGRVYFTRIGTSIFSYLNVGSFKVISPSTLPVLAICRFGLNGIFTELWDSGHISPSSTNIQSDCLLDLAAEAGSIQICKKLVESGAMTDYCHGTCSALSIVAECGHREIFDLLLNNRTSLGLAQSEYGNALEKAADRDRAKMFNALLAILTDETSVDVTGTYGKALIAAARRGSLELVQSLVEKGVSVDLLLDDNDGSALAAAAYGDSLEVAYFLVEKGATVDLLLDGYCGSALASAACHGSLKVASFLVEKGASVDLLLDEQCGSALAAAAFFDSLEVAQFLIEKGATVDLLLDGQSYGSALAAAACQDGLEVAQFLIEKGATVDLLLDGPYGSALTAAACHGSLKVASFLVEKGASVDLLLDGDYGSALTAAVYGDSLEVAQFLVEKGASVDLPLRNGAFGSALAAAASRGGLKVARFLVENGASVDLLLQGGFFGSALAAAAAGGQIEIVNYLIVEEKANLNLPLKAGRYGTALNAASYWGQTACVKALLAAGAAIDFVLGHDGFSTAIEASEADILEDRDDVQFYWSCFQGRDDAGLLRDKQDCRRILEASSSRAD
ncbi:ankyrin [Penicillium verhagenii]|uniref:ankyrin n=1 Tax=Penicillium verhagenii TaxID=1562060 RepID=UPI002545424F|nr:ankyrin [Penicillium verhagenii]KAJ5930697.1 ankyrin [Penicillium verhagenii]